MADDNTMTDDAMPDEAATTDSGDVTTDDGGGWAERIVKALKMKGIELGDHGKITDPDQLAHLIEVACLNSAGDEDELPMPDDYPENEGEMGDMGAPPPGATDAPPPPIQMSQRERVLHDRMISSERASLVKRAERVAKSGLIPPAAGDSLVNKFRTVRLSINANGEFDACPEVVELSAYERVLANRKSPTPGKKGVRLSQPPADAKGAGRSPYHEHGDQDTDAIVDGFEKAVGRAN